MGDNLPLIPGKENVCADVKPVLREVFREKDQLPPIPEKSSATDDEKQWLEKYNSECEKIWHHEGDLRQKFAERISKKPAPNLYKLYGPESKEDKEQDGLIVRKDLMPSILQSATGKKSLWVQNVLNKSSCDVIHKDKPVDTRMHQPLKTIGLDEYSRQTYSVGELAVRKTPAPPVEIIKPVPEYVYCLPEQINFVNFSLGHTNTQHLRLINVSKFEIRLSVSLPKRSELKIELSGSRGLRVTAGSATELKIHFHPNDVRAFHDELRIRTSLGKGLILPITCYMEPPELHIFVQKIETSVFTSSDLMAFKISENEGNIVDLGAKLLGEQHYASLVLQCNEAHASFFLLTEDAWLECNVEELTDKGNLKTGPFTIHPAWWSGGGIVRGIVRCCASDPGFHSAEIRVLSSTAVTRLFHVVADSVFYDPAHITIKAHEKDYDINSEDDPNCEYYVNLGTAFPNRPLCAMIQIVNHSPLLYSFSWKTRPWGICSCWQEHLDSESVLEEQEEASNQLCPGALAAKEAGEKLADSSAEGNTCRVQLEPERIGIKIMDRARVYERSVCPVRVYLPDTGAQLGTKRFVLQLILENIPIESFKLECKPNIVCTRIVDEVGPDGKVWTRTVCDIVQAQIEVWWNVVPVRFALDPLVLPLTHSRRVKAVPVSFCATQLYGVDDISTLWHSSAPMVLPAGLELSPLNSIGAKLVVPLPLLPNEYPEDDVITLKTGTDEWSVSCRVTRACATRHPGLTPARHWLGVVVPGAKICAKMEIFNNTHQDICWWATPYRWTGENPPSKACAQADQTCDVCLERACTCSLLRPSRGSLNHNRRSRIEYHVHAPMVFNGLPFPCEDPKLCCRHSEAVEMIFLGSSQDYSPYPYCVIKEATHNSAKKDYLIGEACDLDPGVNVQGCALLRPSRVLTPCCCSCYKLRITNTTPIATTVRWEPPLDGEEFLRVKFLPNDFEIGSYNEKQISVILEPRRVCRRRLFVFRARVAHAYKPLYLLIDTAIDGVRIICEVPLGGGERNNSVIALRGIQMETNPRDDTNKPTTPDECFEAEDRKRAIVQENICHCKFELKYIPPVKPLHPPSSVPSSTEIVTSPPSLTRVCECFGKTKPVVPAHEEPCCLQFRSTPIKTVTSRRLTLRNDGKVTARWRMVVRRWPRQRNRVAAIHALTFGGDPWAGDVRPPGVAIQCTPAKGICMVGQSVDILVQVYADCWGLYYDQIMLMVDHVEPIVVDVWIEVVGPVLQFATHCTAQEFESTMWLSTSDPQRTLRVKNTSRSQLIIHAYTLLEHEHFQDSLPFRLYMRFTDNLKPVCPCSKNASSDSLAANEESSTFSDTMYTGIEVYLAEDHGLHDEQYYQVEPQVGSMAPGEWKEWRVSLNPLIGGETAPPGLVLLRTLPVDDRGNHWFRWEPAPARVGVRQAPRAAVLRLSCKEVRAHMCALELHYNEIARVRKRFRMRNIDTAPILVRCVTEAPWQIVVNKQRNDCECGCEHELGERHDEIELMVEPWSSTPMCVEVTVDTVEMWPIVEEANGVDKKCVLSSYPPKRVVTGQVVFSCDEGILETLPLILDVDFPRLSLEPEAIDFGFVTHGDTRKTYFSVWHSSLSATITLGVMWHGSARLRVYPRHLRVAPGKRERVYLQYTAAWTGAPVPVEGCVQLAAAAGAGAWCRGALYVHAQPARDAKFSQDVHDHTDQWNLWPPSLPRL